MFIESNDKLEKNFNFINFRQALDFVNVVGNIAEEENHHPDIFIYDYKKVKITLFTHTENKITEKDYKLAKVVEEIYNN